MGMPTGMTTLKVMKSYYCLFSSLFTVVFSIDYRYSIEIGKFDRQSLAASLGLLREESPGSIRQDAG